MKKSILLLMSFAAIGSSSLNADMFDDLISNSPFRNDKNDVVQTSLDDRTYEDHDGDVIESRYELRGVLSMHDVGYFNLYDTSSGESFWIQTGDISHGIEIDSFEPTRQILYFHTAKGEIHAIELKNYIHDLQDAGVTIVNTYNQE